MAKFMDITGQRYGKLIVLYWAGRNKHGQSMWMCKCDCGNEKVISLNSLRRGTTRSCGCLEEENRKAFGGKSKRTHLSTKTRLYRIWLLTKTRCHNPNSDHFADYGARGIKVCDEWINSFPAFKEWAMANGYSDELTIERVDVNRGYEPSNCRWATVADQQRNKRNNRYYTYRGKTQLIPAWAKEFGVTDSTIRSRIRRGEKPEDVFRMLERMAV